MRNRILSMSLLCGAVLSSPLACTAGSKPGPRAAPSKDPWKGYGLGAADANTEETAEGRKNEPGALGQTAPPAADTRDPGLELSGQAGELRGGKTPNSDGGPPRQQGVWTFDETLELKESGGTRLTYKRVQVFGEMRRIDQYEQASRETIIGTEIQRDGGTFYINPADGSATFAVSAFDHINDPSTAYYFKDLKARNKWKPSGEATVQEVDCVVYEKQRPARAPGSETLWVAKEPAGFLLRHYSKNLLGIESTITRSLPTPSTQTPSDFEPPTE